MPQVNDEREFEFAVERQPVGINSLIDRSIERTRGKLEMAERLPEVEKIKEFFHRRHETQDDPAIRSRLEGDVGD